MYAVVNLSALERFDNGAVVTIESLVDTGLVGSVKDGVKILGNGDLTKKLTVRATQFSKSAEEKITALGGTVEIV